MRGLKPSGNRCAQYIKTVASFTDAWIETSNNTKLEISLGRIFYRCVDWNTGDSSDFSSNSVASFTDAWIETKYLGAWKDYDKVASFTDAWIETTVANRTAAILSRIFYRCVDWNHDPTLTTIADVKSHLLQMRGLKLKDILEDDVNESRIFYRCVDWNISAERISRNFNVASFTDAWIETRSKRRLLRIAAVASFTDAWIETYQGRW